MLSSTEVLRGKVATQIINDLATSQLSSYQIAYKYKVKQKTVESLGISNLGEQIYKQKEELAISKLYSDINELSDEGQSRTQIAQKLGLYNSTSYQLIKKAEEYKYTQIETNDSDLVNVISISEQDGSIKSLSHSNSTPLAEKEPQSKSILLTSDRSESYSKKQLPINIDTPQKGGEDNQQPEKVASEHNNLRSISIKFDGIEISYESECSSTEQAVLRIIAGLRKSQSAS